MKVVIVRTSASSFWKDDPPLPPPLPGAVQVESSGLMEDGYHLGWVVEIKDISELFKLHYRWVISLPSEMYWLEEWKPGATDGCEYLCELYDDYRE